MSQGLQSCLDPQILEPHVLMNKMSPPISKISPQDNWSFTQILNNPTSYNYQPDNKENAIYIHPSTKLSSSVMSTRSLDMCTEILGSESGSFLSESMDERDSSRGVQRSKCREFKKRIKKTVDFPPPLTSISGMERVRVKSHREGSRLVLRAVSISACSSYFQAERANGTLRLSWLKKGLTSLKNDSTSYVEDKVEQITEVENVEEAGDGYWKEANSCPKLRSEIGVPRPRRCTEKSRSRSKGISNWGQFWVAIS
ncbi:protein FANTASTIC FOUR 3-like [Lycium ferocissimum]|uniref:protein FANTASTIC FOUR 3-like n=1 Tax=Lycium ferocissimum TaxID=112874 RepID=UPI002814D0F9|nr:protein FANTASTIC FOUR 3-like [Lycium ferocissimum]